MQTIEQALEKLSRSSFRAKFHLSQTELRQIQTKGLAQIRSHAQDFVRTRLAPAQPYKDGHQTPMRGHPVFVAQHACACCCRKCLNRWYRVPMGVELTPRQQEKIVSLLMAWIERQLPPEQDLPVPEQTEQTGSKP